MVMEHPIPCLSAMRKMRTPINGHHRLVPWSRRADTAEASVDRNRGIHDLDTGKVYEPSTHQGECTMKSINVTFEDAEYEKLLKAKNDLSWHDFIMELVKK